MNPADHIEQRATESLIPYAKNARTHSEEQVAQIAASMREWGFTNPVLCDEAGMIIAGHGRVMAAKLLGLIEVPVMTARGWTDEQKRAYVIADNKLALNSDWNMSMLAEELGALDTGAFDELLIGFSSAELESIAVWAPTQPPPPERDVIPPAPAEPIVKRGEVWRLGRHRLMCGDCRIANDVFALIGATKINLAFTSPPYAEQRAYDEASGFQPIAPAEYVAWFGDVAANVQSVLAPDGSWFVNIKPHSEELDTSLYVLDLVLAHVRSWGWHFATEFCWQKVGVPQRVVRRFKNQYEPIYQFTRGEWKFRPDSVRHHSDMVPLPLGVDGGARTHTKRKGEPLGVLESQGVQDAMAGHEIVAGLAYPGNRLPTFSGSHQVTGHAAAFPVGLPEFFIKAYTDASDSVYDPFAGSGSTLIAAEGNKRNAFGMELSPAYCDIIITRWQNLTGEQATRIE